MAVWILQDIENDIAVIEELSIPSKT